MKLTGIRASAGCTIPHPYESYSNIKLFVELSAELTDGEDPAIAAIQLQNDVNALIWNERGKRIDELKRAHEKEQAKRRVEREKQQAIWDAEREVHEATLKLANLKLDADSPDEIDTDVNDEPEPYEDH